MCRNLTPLHIMALSETTIPHSVDILQPQRWSQVESMVDVDGLETSSGNDLLIIDGADAESNESLSWKGRGEEGEQYCPEKFKSHLERAMYSVFPYMLTIHVSITYYNVVIV